MRIEVLSVLCCPKTGSRLELEDAVYEDEQIRSGWLVSEYGQARYPIRDFIPRFVPESNYADNFGVQWNHFRQTQLDSFSGHPISGTRLWKATNWSPDEIKGKWVLDVGCGAGRFAEVIVKSGAQLLALDYSNAVDACYANLKQYHNLHVIQADVYAMPFVKELFPFIYSLGVLHHTPDVAKAFFALAPFLEPEGRLCVDFYERSWKSRILPKNLLRPFTKQMSMGTLFGLLERWVPRMLPVSIALGRIPIVGSLLKRIIPVANYQGVLPISEQQLYEWALLDTFDWFAPAYDNPQTADTIYSWFFQAGLKEVEVLKAGLLVGRGRKPR